MDTPIRAAVPSIPPNAIRCVVRHGESRAEILRTNTPIETRLDVVSGLHGMGVFRLDYLDDRWLLSHEFVTVDVDAEKLTAPTIAAVEGYIPYGVSADKDTPPAATDAVLGTSNTNIAQPSFESVFADNGVPLSHERTAALRDEENAIRRRCDDLREAVLLYEDAAIAQVMKKFGIDKNKISSSPRECLEMVQECLAAFPELYMRSPESNGASPDDAAQPNAAVPQPAYPRLREHLRDRSLVIIGGIPVQQRIGYIEKLIGVVPEWPETDPNGNNSVAQRLVRRIKDGEIGAVIIAHGLIKHSAYFILKEAAAASRVPIAYADKAGNGQLLLSLEQLERELRQAAGGHTASGTNGKAVHHGR